MRGFAELLADPVLVAGPPVESQIVGGFLVQRLAAGLEGEMRGKLLVIEFDLLRRVLRLVQSVGHDHGDGLAYEMNLVRCKEGACGIRALSAAGQVEDARFHPVEDRGSLKILRSQDCMHSVRRPGGLDVQGDDPGVRDRRVEEVSYQRSVGSGVADVPALSGQQPDVFLPLHGLAHAEFQHVDSL